MRSVCICMFSGQFRQEGVYMAGLKLIQRHDCTQCDVKFNDYLWYVWWPAHRRSDAVKCKKRAWS
jgi:hypothetical protein